MSELKIDAVEFDAVVFDVLGTLVDEPAGIRAGIRALDPSLDDPGSSSFCRCGSNTSTASNVASSTASGPTSPATPSTWKPPGSSLTPPESTTRPP